MNDMTKFQELEWQVEMTATHKFHPSTAMAAGENIYIAGLFYGQNVTGGYSGTFDQILIYHPATKTWRMSGEPRGTGFYSAAIYNEQTIYCASSDGIYVYDIPTESWKQDMIDYLQREGGTPRLSIVGDKLYCLFASNENCYPIYNYNIANGRWTVGATMPEKHMNMTEAVVGAKIYYIAGGGGYGTFNLVQIYDTETDNWTRGSDYPLNAQNPSCSAFGPYIFVQGGLAPSDRTKSTYVYDIREDEWLKLADLNFARWAASAVTWNGGIYCLGDYNGGTSAVERLNVISVLDHFVVTQQYEDREGRVVAQDRKFYLLDGESHRAAAAQIDGYVCIGYRLDGGELVGETSLEIARVGGDHTVTFLYKDEGDGFIVTERYQLADGTPVRTATVSYPDKGEDYEKDAPRIPGHSYTGYTVDGGELYEAPTVHLEQVQRDHTVVFLYEYTGVVEPEALLVREQYLDERTGGALRPETATAVERGEYYAKAAPPIEGYKRAGHRIDSGAPAQTLTAVIDSVEREHLVAFLYQPGDDGNGGGSDAGRCCGCCSMPVNIHIENFQWDFDKLIVQQCSCRRTGGEDAANDHAGQK